MNLKEYIVKLLQVRSSKEELRFQNLKEQEQVIQSKGFLKKIYIDWYKEFKKEVSSLSKGVFIELGSGGGFIKEIIPNIITSDILFSVNIDINFSATKLPFKDNVVDMFCMVDVLHHIQNPADFFKEVNRCLKVGGKLIMIEPANTLWARFIYKNFHHEDFNPKANWILEGSNPLYSANGAIPWIIFFRDKIRFQEEFPLLKIKRKRFQMPFSYLVSGGLSMRQLLPTCTYGIVKALEAILAPLNKYIAMFLTLEVEKQ